MNETIDQDCGCDAASAPPGAGKSSAGDMKERAAQSAKNAAATVKQTTAQLASKVKETSHETAAQLKEKSRDFAQSRKDELASRIKGGGEAVRRAAEKLREENDPNIASYANALADRIVSAGEYVQSRDFNGIRQDLERAARRRPEIVFGGMFLAGLAIARFLKASAENSPSYEPRANYASAERSGQDEWAQSSDSPRVSMADVPAAADAPVVQTQTL